MKFFDGLKSWFKGEDDYLLDTHADKDKKINKAVKLKIGKWVIVIPIVAFVVIVFYKTAYRLLANEPQPAVIEKTVETKLNSEIKLNDDEIWKAKAKMKQDSIGENVEELQKGLEDLTTAVVNSANEIKKVVQDGDKTLQEKQVTLEKGLIERIDSTNSQLLDSKITNQKSIDAIKQEIKDGKLQASSTKLKHLDPSKLFSLSKIEHGKNAPPLQAATQKQAPTNNRVIEYEYEDLEVENTNDLSTMANYLPVKKEEKVKEFDLRQGFAKATIITGGDLKTLSEGDGETTPIFLSIDSKIRIANNKELDLTDCGLEAVGKGDFTSSRGHVTVSNISCNLIDDEGNHYKIDQQIVGWVYDEVGSYGVKGRLVTKEGEIMEKALPLAILETGLSILTESAKSDSSSDNAFQIGNASSGVASNAGGKIVDKMGDYWLKYLDGLNPLVSFRPGRQVVVAFKGGEKLKVEKYIPADVEKFEEEFEEVEDYVN